MSLVVGVAAGVSVRHVCHASTDDSSSEVSRARELHSKGALVLRHLSPRQQSSVSSSSACSGSKSLPSRSPRSSRRRVVRVSAAGPGTDVERRAKAANVNKTWTAGTSTDDSDYEVPLAWYPPGLQEWESAVKEGSRKYRRASFTPERWAAHRSIGRYWRHVTGMPTSRVVRGLLAPCSFTTGIAFLACVTRPYYAQYLDLSSPLPFELTAASLGLMLVFRTNSSYARFVKAHEAWNLIMSRAIEARYISLGACKDPELRDLLGRYLLAYPIALKNKYRPPGPVEDGEEEEEEESPVVPAAQQRQEKNGGGGGGDGGGGGGVNDTDGIDVFDVVVREDAFRASGYGYASRARMRETGMSTDLERVLRPAEAADLSRRLDKPGHALHVLYTAAGYLGEQEGVRMPTLGRFMECLAAFSGAARQCDMLWTTPIPLSYTRHTSRFLLLWLSFLSFPLAFQLSEYSSVPAMFFISMLLMGVEEIGVQIEEPLSIMDLEGMVAALEAGFEEAEISADDVEDIFLDIGIGRRGLGGDGKSGGGDDGGEALSAGAMMTGWAAQEELKEEMRADAQPEPEVQAEVEWWKKTKFYE